jgi:hypothetical protein
MDELEAEDLAAQVALLTARLTELEARVTQLESGAGRTKVAAPASASSQSAPVTAGTGSEDLIAAISQVLGEIGEADVGAIRQQLAKTGWASLGRSDVNKVLYAHKDRFIVARQEGVKPIWKLV